MATITVDCSDQANVQGIRTVVSDATSGGQVAELIFELSGTYDTGASESIELTNVDTAIETFRRNGKTVVITGACASQFAQVSAGTEYRLNVTAFSATGVDGTVLTGASTEYTNSTALPTFTKPFGVMVSFYES